MNIEFDCPSCGRHYSVKPEAAGKRGPCKGCGKPITIPAASAALDSLYEIDDDPEPDPEAEPALASSPPLGGRRRAPSAGASAPQTKGKGKTRKPKSDSLYETLWGSESMWGGPGCTTLNKVVRGVVSIGFCLAVAAFVVVAAKAGRASRADVEKLARAEVDSLNTLTQLFRSAEDADGARAAAEKAVPVIQAWTKRVKEAQKLRVRKDDMADILAEFLGPIDTASAAMWGQVERVQSIDGAGLVLASVLKPPLDELLAVVPPEESDTGPLKHSTPVILPVPTRGAPAALHLSIPSP